MKEPTILHDHVLGGMPMYKDMLRESESGKLDPYSPKAMDLFTLPQVGFAQSMYLLYTSLLGYRKFGQQTFVVGPRLQEMLENTSLNGIPKTVLQFPYDFFYIALPESGHRVWGGPTGWHELTGIMVSRHRAWPDKTYTVRPDGSPRPEGDSLILYLWGRENERSVQVGDDASFWVDLNLSEAQQYTDMEAYLEWMLSNPSREWSDLLVNNPHTDPGWELRTGDKAPLPSVDAARLAMQETTRACLRVVLNLLVYLQSESAERTGHPTFDKIQAERKDLEESIKRKKNPGKKKNLAKALSRLSDAHVTWLGRTIEETATGGTRKVAGQRVQHWVRGHWRRTKKVSPSHQWIMPYLRNKDADMKEPSRQYKVRDEAVTPPETSGDTESHPVEPEHES